MKPHTKCFLSKRKFTNRKIDQDKKKREKLGFGRKEMFYISAFSICLQHSIKWQPKNCCLSETNSTIAQLETLPIC